MENDEYSQLLKADETARKNAGLWLQPGVVLFDCPVCGGEARSDYRREYGRMVGYVTCANCKIALIITDGRWRE
ncbi:hypothetical protein LJC34_03675 [Oscillospiraceae bacterium OttesenSCG-928-G22]|nr:hypothetical protein [Oscillospiraceae bacterium OttesenSCG-928-G22]